MIPTRRDWMLTEILLVIQILKSVYMILPFIPPRWDLGNRCRLNEMKNKHFIPPSQDEKLPYKHFIPAWWDELFPFEHACCLYCNKNMMSST